MPVAVEDGKLADRVAPLVKQLDAASKADRDAAEQGLVKLGAAAMVYLPADDAPVSAEAALRLKRIRKQFEQLEVEQFPAARAVTLHADQMPLDQALAEIERQTGNPLVDHRQKFGQLPGPVAITLDVQDAPFWPVLDRLLDQAMMTTYPYADTRALALVNRAPNMLPRAGRAVYWGAFRIEAVDLTSRRDLRDPSRDHFRTLIELSWEPRFRPVVVKLPRRDVRVQYDDQAERSATDRTVLEPAIGSRAKAYEFDVWLPIPPHGSRRISSLKGEFQLQIPGREADFRFKNLAGERSLEQRQAGVTVALESVVAKPVVRPAGGQPALRPWEVSLRVTFDKAGQALESHRNWTDDNPLWIETPDGQRLDPLAQTTTRQSDREFGVSFTFQREQGLDNCTLVYRTPTAIIDVVVPFELKGLELP
ncbi:MAG: hypothetical protein JSS27_00840 [Planctomycetes bacterium]|nr:hypothetical protein [Planctomycetota bacterium]